MAEIAVNYNVPIVTPKEARARGLKRYFSGEPPKNYRQFLDAVAELEAVTG